MTASEGKLTVTASTIAQFAFAPFCQVHGIPIRDINCPKCEEDPKIFTPINKGAPRFTADLLESFPKEMIHAHCKGHHIH